MPRRAESPEQAGRSRPGTMICDPLLYLHGGALGNAGGTGSISDLVLNKGTVHLYTTWHRM